MRREIKIGIIQRVDHGAQPLRALGVPVTRAMAEHVVMGVERDSHASS
jgi:hypothetical protein